MGTSAIPVILTFALLLVAWQVVFASNRDLVRAKAWGELSRRLIPFAAIAVMAASAPLVQNPQVWWLPYAWLLAFGVVLVVANFVSMPLDERRATRAFRTGDYAGAAALYRRLVERRPLARYWAFLGAALGAAERHEEGVDASTKAVEIDPKYGLAYYNRALILRRLGRKSRATKDLKRALEADLPRRFRTAARRALEES
ncbi:MAG: FOG: TPR repeat [uncultured Rubrobacteraceae bacterium]|uniref:FOG: TPR repeat n=1 Tax=uncultured Rubrobacteraceae bacterium TaxID=349277 RepID=A0A6J4QRF0_9ACTN|nr:MAG: FOG: TPR repeat [uncultured Rubrobacteraceae bacterium]